MPRTLCRDCWEIFTSGPGACPGCLSERLVTHAELEDLCIAHVDCDAFYASVEKRDRPELADKPLIVGHPGGRGVVTTACYIARRYGVRSAMPMFQAIERCPQAVVIAPDMAKYKQVSAGIRDIFRSATEIIEPVSLDEAYLDLSPEYRLSESTAAQALARVAAEIEAGIGITVSIGLSANKFLAKLASEQQKPRGYSVIGAAEARMVLAGLPISKINGVGAATAARLEAAGMVTIADLQARGERELVGLVGKLGRRLAQFAVGEDDRAVTPDRAAKSISAETTFRRDIGRLGELVEAARPLTARVAETLVRKGLAGSTLVLKLKTSDFRILSRNRRLAHPTQRAGVLLDAVVPLIEREADGRLFRLIGIGVDGLVPAAEADPPDLFGGLGGPGPGLKPPRTPA
jgi:DNA polymerase IV